MKRHSDRREFLKLTAAGAATLTMSGASPLMAQEKRTARCCIIDGGIARLRPVSRPTGLHDERQGYDPGAP